MKRFFLFLFLTTVTLNLFSQTTVSGRIVDDQKQPVPYATVCVNKNNQLLYGTTSAPDGRFEIDNIAKGEYVVLFSSLGMTIRRSTWCADQLIRYWIWAQSSCTNRL